MKGRDFEKAVQARLEQQGWVVHRALPNTGRRGLVFYTNSNDLFGCIDLVAVHPERGLWWIQCGTVSHISSKRKDVEEVPWPKAMLDGAGSTRLRVSVFEAAERPDDLNRRRKVHLARVHDLRSNGMWETTMVLQVHPLPAPEEEP